MSEEKKAAGKLFFVATALWVTRAYPVVATSVAMSCFMLGIIVLILGRSRRTLQMLDEKGNG